MSELRSKLSNLEDDCMKLGKERETINSEKQLIEKRAKIEEETLQKRIHMLEGFQEEQDNRSKQLEKKYESEIDHLKKSYDE